MEVGDIWFGKRNEMNLDDKKGMFYFPGVHDGGISDYPCPGDHFRRARPGTATELGGFVLVYPDGTEDIVCTGTLIEHKCS